MIVARLRLAAVRFVLYWRSRVNDIRQVIEAVYEDWFR